MDDLKIGDKVYTAADLEKPEVQKEITELAMKGLDYTKKTQEVADERKEIERLKAQFDDPAFQSTRALHDALAENPKLAEEIDRIAKKYESGEGDLPTAGSADDKAMNAELKKLRDEFLGYKTAQEKAAQEQKLHEAYTRIHNQIDGYLDAHNLDGDKAKDVAEMVRTVAFRHALEQGQAGTLTPEGLKAFVDQKVSLFQNPALLKKAQAKEQNAIVSGNAGGGAPPPATPPPQQALPGSDGYRERVKAAVEKASKA